MKSGAGRLVRDRIHGFSLVYASFECAGLLSRTLPRCVFAAHFAVSSHLARLLATPARKESHAEQDSITKYLRPMPRDGPE